MILKLFNFNRQHQCWDIKHSSIDRDTMKILVDTITKEVCDGKEKDIC